MQINENYIFCGHPVDLCLTIDESKINNYCPYVNKYANLNAVFDVKMKIMMNVKIMMKR